MLWSALPFIHFYLLLVGNFVFSVITATTATTVTMIQTHTRFFLMLIYYDIDNMMQIFSEIPFFRPQNDT